MKTFIFVVGAPKAGTFYLHEVFCKTDGIRASVYKEPNFFVDAIFNAHGMRYCKTENEYLRQFRFDHEDGHAATIAYSDCSPSYLRCSKAPGRIRSFCDKMKVVPKIIILLREPVSRAFSNWKMDVRQGHQKLDFLSALRADAARRDAELRIQYEYYRSSVYSDAVARFLEVFSKDNVHIGIAERTRLDKVRYLTELESFLGNNIALHRLASDANADIEPRNRIVSLLYNNKTIRTLQRSLLSDSHKELMRGVFFKKAESKPLDAAVEKCAREFFQKDVQSLRYLLSDPLNEWKYDQ